MKTSNLTTPLGFVDGFYNGIVKSISKGISLLRKDQMLLEEEMCM